jgi:tetratricopeptide (TPR) repeat protein
VADKDEKKPASTAAPNFDPKPVQVGGESIVDRLLPHVKKIVIGVVAATIVVAGFSVVVWFRDRKESAATNKLAKVLDIASRPVKPPEPVEPPPDEAKPGETKPGEAKPVAKQPENTFPDDKARALAVLTTLSSEGDSVASHTFRGSQLMEAGKVDDAIAAFHEGEHADGVDGVLSREGLGLALEAKAVADKDATARQKGLEQALAAFHSMQPDEKAVGAGEAYYHQGRILVELGRRDEAKAAFEKAKTLAKESDLPELIDQRLAMLGA